MAGMIRHFWTILQLVLISHTIKACFFKAKQLSAKEMKAPGHWNDMKAERNTTGSSCECGKNVKNEPPPWSLYIHVKKSRTNPSQITTCMGTIITSNLIATSHECVRLPEKKLNVYDAWDINPENKNLVRKQDIELRKSMDPNGQGEVFVVEEIIPNPNFLFSSAIKKNPELDFLLLKVKADFTSHKDLCPICIPEDINGLDFVGQLASYYKAEKEDAEDSDIGCYEGIIFTQKMCDKDTYRVADDREEQDELSPLCLRWDSRFHSSPPPKELGRTVFLKSLRNESFLAGISCNATRKKTKEGVDYVYFANIIPMIKYLEYRAHQHHSKWCKTPKLDLPKRVPNADSKIGTWPWERESIQKSFKVRNESLNCVCGVPNDKLTGRIVGGKEATPYEFGWMSYVKVRHLGKNGGSFMCGGTIINDRMILTAAHCLIYDAHLKRMPPKSPVTSHELVDVILNVHNRNRDEKAITKKVKSVIIHPDYVPSRNQGYFDYDLALLVLEDTLVFPPLPEQGIRPVCLPKVGESMKTLDEIALAVGWGRTHPDISTSIADKLQKIKLPIIDLQQCRSVARSKVTDHFLCAGSLDKFKDAAPGDSGGPLKILLGKQYYEVGIVSWGEENKHEGKWKTAALYTDVTHPVILPFIDYSAKRLGAQWCKSYMTD